MKIKKVSIPEAGRIAWEEVEEDLNPGPRDLLLESECTFISAGTELANFRGVSPGIQFPLYPGYANVGRVLECGKELEGFAVGDRVFSFSRHQSHAKETISGRHYDHMERNVIKVPEAMSSKVAAALRMAGVATTSIIIADIPEDPWVVIYGLGMVGNLAAQAFVIKGCRVIGVDLQESRQKMAKACGIEHAIGGSNEEVLSQIEEITEGKMCQIAVESVGHSAVASQAIKTVSRHGQLILLGTPRAPFEANLTDFLNEVHMRYIHVKGALEWCLPNYPEETACGELFPRMTAKDKYEMIYHWSLSGKLKVEPLLTHEFPAEEIEEAYRCLMEKPEEYIGVTLSWK